MGIHSANSWVAVCSRHTVPRETGVARGEASRDAPVPVLRESVCDDSQVPSHCPLVCMMEAASFV